MSLRSILGGSRIKKKSSSSKPRSTSQHSSSASGSSLSSWQRTKSTTSGSGARKKNQPRHSIHDDDGDDYFHDDDDKLPDHGLVRALANDPTLRDVPQALRYSRAHMFDPMPTSHAGMGSVRTATVLRYRAAMPPLATTAHVQALLLSAGPTAVERETAELTREGSLRRIVVPRRGGVGEALILMADLEDMVRNSAGLDAATGEAFVAFLKENPAAVRVPRVVAARRGCAEGNAPPMPGLSHAQTDELVRAGFLTAQHTGHDAGNATGAFSRPEDRYSLMSLQSVSQAASGSMGAVGGAGALHAAGGSGAGRGGGPAIDLVSGPGDLSLAVPGHGAYLKLVSAALEHLEYLLQKSQFREAPETSLQEKWDGGVASDETAAAKRARGEFAGIMPGRTKKWKEFYGLSFDWVLQEAVGTGLVEVFETRSVGRGVRLV